MSLIIPTSAPHSFQQAADVAGAGGESHCPLRHSCGFPRQLEQVNTNGLAIQRYSNILEAAYWSQKIFVL